MKKKINTFIVPLFLLIFLLGFYLGRIVYKDNSLFYSSNSNFRKIKVLTDYLQDNYKNKINITDFLEQSLIKKIKQLDPYSDFVSADYYKEWENEVLSNNFYGIGIEYRNWKDTIHIISVFQNSPAQKAGLRPLDMIVEVDGHKIDAKNFKINKNIKYKLKVIKYSTGKTVYLSLRAENIEYNNIIAKNLDSGIIYIHIKAFSKNVFDQFVNAVDSLSKITKFKAFIIDLRDNGGGLLKTSVELAEKFLSKGDTIVITENKFGQKSYFVANENGKFCKLPLVLVVNEETASAAEIFAMAIQDNDRGYLLGYPTFGKGVYQQDVKLYDFYAHITTGKYFGPSGRNLSEFSESDTFSTKNGRKIIPDNGVDPDEVILSSGYRYMAEDSYGFKTFDSLFYSFVYSPKCQLRHISNSKDLKRFLKLNTYTDLKKWMISQDSEIDEDTLFYILFGNFVLPNDIIEKSLIINDKPVVRAKSIINENKVEQYILKDSIIEKRDIPLFGI